MKYELILFLLTSFFVYNSYHDGKYTKIIMSYKKYFKMAGIIIISLVFYFTLKKDPSKCRETLQIANQFIKYTPVNKDAVGMANPVLNYMNNLYSIDTQPQTSEPGFKTSSTSKRSVSGIKKKYVASNQDWKCAMCGNTLNAWFEVDHHVRLDKGGSNDVSNLMALCRECHGQKTAMESMD
tara:strand:- start:14 stop:556 length:543 start_codon:yes stop_codon:yes gene_type:complete